MITIDLLKNHPEAIERLSTIWYDVLGQIWLPDIPIDRVIHRFREYLNEDVLPLTIIALDQDKPVGMCSLKESDGIRPELSPWLGSLVVDPAYQKKSIGKILIDATKQKALELEFKKLYLFAFDQTIPDYYSRLAWKTIGMDEFKGLPVTVMEIAL